MSSADKAKLNGIDEEANNYLIIKSPIWPIGDFFFFIILL
jgi:hypothetical protein